MLFRSSLSLLPLWDFVVPLKYAASSIFAVSYTHLDVYKRQVLSSTTFAMLATLTPSFRLMSLTPVVIRPSTVTSVSYTHLVFAKQLLEPILCGQVSLAPLLPKLRGHFAEFLDNASRCV